MARSRAAGDYMNTPRGSISTALTGSAPLGVHAETLRFARGKL